MRPRAEIDGSSRAGRTADPGVGPRPLKDTPLQATNPRQAMRTQEELAGRVIQRDVLPPIREVAGVDVHFPRSRKLALAAVAVLSFPELVAREERTALQPIAFPYVPGLLSFREVPPILAALDKLSRPPELLLCDGQGYAHPRRFGLACHLGVITDTASIGVAKSRLIGEHRAVPDERGRWVPLVDAGETVGAVLRTRVGVRPVYVSVGHRVSLRTAVELVLRCTTRYRLPEPARAAHRLADAGFKVGR